MLTSESFVEDVRTAYKRCKHFCSKATTIPVMGTTGLCIPIRNATFFMDSGPADAKFDLLAIHWMATKINGWIDSHQVEGDDESIAAMSVFLSRVWFDPMKLEVNDAYLSM